MEAEGGAETDMLASHGKETEEAARITYKCACFIGKEQWRMVLSLKMNQSTRTRA
jgi:hypothetical protein